MFIKLPRAVFAPDGNDGSVALNGGGGTQSSTPSSAVTTEASPTTPAAPTPNWSEFVSGLEKLSGDLGGKLDTLVGEVKTLPEQLTPQAPAAPPPDFDTMSNAELAAHIVGTIGEQIKAQIAAALEPLSSQVGTLRNDVTTRAVTQSIERMRTEHKDFNDWKDEMVGLAKQHPSLDIPDLYSLARARNPAKAGELDKKYTPPPAPPAPRWGGLLPTTNANGASPTMSPKQAGIEAYREVAARHPGVLTALENL